eukprot:symbB.v1.2.039165.t1/scaffold6381.1/size18562/1
MAPLRLCLLLYLTAALVEESLVKLWEEELDCLLLDVFDASVTLLPSFQLDVEAVRQGPFVHCNFHVFWAKGRGLSLDWIPKGRLCDLYQAVLVEDEYLLDTFRA